MSSNIYSMWYDIQEFHHKFELPQENVPSIPKNNELINFRISFLKEELNEFIVAVANQDRTKAFDALIDIVYVAMGTANICHFPWEKGWKHVHDANMRKVRAKEKSESKRNTTYDVIKPDGWVSPDRIIEAELLAKEYYILTGLK